MKNQSAKKFLPVFMVAGTMMINSCTTSSGGSPCLNADGALSDASFVIVETPRSGQRVSSGFAVTGCSRTFESNVNWILKNRKGVTIASGNTSGGGVDGPGNFSTTVNYSVASRQIGHLEVFEEDVSDGEGFPPGRNVIPVVLQP